MCEEKPDLWQGSRYELQIVSVTECCITSVLGESFDLWVQLVRETTEGLLTRFAFERRAWNNAWNNTLANWKSFVNGCGLHKQITVSGNDLSFFFYSFFFLNASPHPAPYAHPVDAEEGSKLSNPGTGADWVAGAGAIWVFCGSVSEKEALQKHLPPRSDIPISQGKRKIPVYTAHSKISKVNK